ncbi:PEP-utilizing enzyme [Prevotella copri]|nr:PEP-utilizing enzyme [Segatella copri]MCP9547764.1 PEP-utilizing enzyme [Segatella copri]
MSAAEGILTARGGMTSHAAVVARGKKYVSRIRKLSCTTVIFDGIADVKKKQTYEKQ